MTLRCCLNPKSKIKNPKFVLVLIHRLRGMTLVELVIVMVIGAIVFAVTPRLLFQGVGTMVWLPRQMAVNRAATEIMQQLVEGGFSTLPGTPVVRGLRFATRRSVAERALWLATPTQIGFLTSDNQSILIWLNGAVIRRGVVAASCAPALPAQDETLPYDVAAGGAQILPAAALFRYYNQGGVEIVSPGCPPTPTIRRVDISFVAQTGNGNFQEGNTRESMTSSVAIRVP